MAKKLQISNYYTTGGTAPLPKDLIDGQIALSLSGGSEAIYFKNNDGDVVSVLTSGQTYDLITSNTSTNILNTDNTFTGVNTFMGVNNFRNNINLYDNTNPRATPFNIKNELSTLNVNYGSNRHLLALKSNSLNSNSLNLFINTNISGDTSITGSTTISGNTSITGTCTSTGGFYDTSDKRLKKFDGDIDVNLDDIKKIKKTYFHYKKDKNKQQHIGVSAQDIEKLYPQIVNVNSDGYLAVDYSKLSVIALKAIDVLSEENKTLKTKLIDLEKRLTLLENK